MKRVIKNSFLNTLFNFMYFPNKSSTIYLSNYHFLFVQKRIEYLDDIFMSGLSNF